MKILAIDPGTKLGWCVYQHDPFTGGSVKASGTYTGLLRTKDDHPGRRWRIIERWFLETWKLHGPFDQAICERAHHRGLAATKLAYGIITQLEKVALDTNTKIVFIHPARLKKLATGIGNVSKEDMLIVATKILGRSPVSDDEADAVLMAVVAARHPDLIR